MASIDVIQLKNDNRVEGADVYVPEPSFSLGKSPSQNGLSASQVPIGTGGLGEGTPKVLQFQLLDLFFHKIIMLSLSFCLFPSFCSDSLSRLS